MEPTFNTASSLATQKVQDDIYRRLNALSNGSLSEERSDRHLSKREAHLTNDSGFLSNKNILNASTIPGSNSSSTHNSVGTLSGPGFSNHTGISTEYLNSRQQECLNIQYDVQLKKQLEETELERLNLKISGLNMSRSARIQYHLNKIEREKIEVQKLELLAIKKELEAKTSELEERKRRLELARKKQEDVHNDLMKKQKYYEDLEAQCIEKERKRKETEEENERLKRSIQKQKEEDELKERKYKEIQKAKQQAAKEEEARAKAEAEAEAKAKAKAKKEAERKQRELEQEKNKSFTSQDEVNNEFEANKQRIADIKANVVLPISQNPGSKKDMIALKRKIKARLGQLTSSKRQLLEIFDDLSQAIGTAKTSNQPIYFWGLNFFSKTVLDQAETEVSVSLDRALPLALLCCYMMTTFSDLKDFLIPRFFKKCPFLLGYTCSLGSEKGRNTMGWKDGEDPSLYNERMAGITATWATLTSCQPLSPNDVHPYPISHAWKFLSRMLNTPVERLTDGHFAVVGGWWDVSSKVLEKAFGRQGTKILQLICSGWAVSVKDNKFPAAKRLELIGNEFRTNKFKALKSISPLED